MMLGTYIERLKAIKQMLQKRLPKGQQDGLETSNLPDPKLRQSTRELNGIPGGGYPRYVLMTTIIGGIVLAEVIAMIVVYYYRFLPYYQQVIIDTAVMTAIIFPLLYYLSFKPLLVHIQRRSQVENISQVRLRLIQFADTHAWDELMQYTLDEIEALTGSTIGFFHFLETDQKNISLQAWSTNTLQNMCESEGKGSHYDLDRAGVWADCARLRQPIIINDYNSLENRKGTPDGHAPIIRLVSVPIMRDEQVTAILGVGNKTGNYTANDVDVISTIADFAWDIIDRKRAEEALQDSEEKFRTLVEWTYDWEKWLDPQGNIVYASPSCERITGYKSDAFIQDPGLLIHIVHPDDRRSYKEHQEIIHDKNAGPMNIEYRIIARDGSEHWIEHVCRPLYDSENNYLGRRVSNRDVTDRKRAEWEIREHSQNEAKLTRTIHTIQTDIARDLHDTIGQNIGYLRMNLEHLSEVILSDQEELQIKIQGMTKAANESYELIRTMLAVLQAEISADPLNLFIRYAEQVTERSSFQVDITSQGDPKYLSPHQMRQLFYIFREALSNIEKYANASHVSGQFTWNENNLTLSISDNGCGFEPDRIPSSGHYGLNFMRERASLLNGSFSIQSALGKGTTITVSAPYEEGFLPTS